MDRPAAKPESLGPEATLSTISHIVLELARERGHPEGDPSHVYHFNLPLLPDGRIDSEGWRRNRPLCRVRRERLGQAALYGQIRHGPGGRWFLDYPGAQNDETGFRLESEHFVLGEYVSIREDDGHLHTFRVTSIRPL
jgi:hypothetical protein